MNLEEKAQAHYKELCDSGFSGDQIVYSKDDFKHGYKECITDLSVLLKANPKLTVKQIIKHLEEVK
jgi:hypothetical protein